MKNKYFKQIAVFTIFIFSSILVKGQYFFEKKYGGDGWESARTLEIESDGYMILSHTTTYSAKGDTDVYLIRTNLQGEVQWTKTIGGEGHDIAYSIKKTSDGNYILGGFTSSKGAGWTDCWLVKIDKQGNVLWDKIAGAGGSEWILDVEQTSDGGYILVGHKHGGNTTDDAIAWKTDASGNTQWYKTLGGTKYDAAHSVKETADGGFMFIGMTNSFSAGDMDLYLVKLKKNGDIDWSKTYGGTDYERGQYISVLNDGYILTGDTKSYGAGSYDAYLLKVNSNGETQWTKTYGGKDKDITKMIQKTSDGGYIIVGNNRSNPQSDPNMWLVKIDANGGMQWGKMYGGIHHEHCYFAKQTPDGGYIVLGHSVRSYTPIYNVDAYLLKVNGAGELKGAVTTGFSDLLSNDLTNIYPNPSNGILNIENQSSSKVELTDISGRIIYSENFVDNSKKTLDMSDKPKGMYFLRSTIGNTQQVKKVILY